MRYHGVKHDFIAVSSEQVKSGEWEIGSYKEILARYDHSSVSDELISIDTDVRHAFLKGFTTYWLSDPNPKEGLLLCSVTWIKNENLHEFISSLHRLKKKRRCVKKLIYLCQYARKGGLDILHLGI